jgi:hypothetical protein
MGYCLLKEWVPNFSLALNIPLRPITVYHRSIESLCPIQNPFVFSQRAFYPLYFSCYHDLSNFLDREPRFIFNLFLSILPSTQIGPWVILNHLTSFPLFIIIYWHILIKLYIVRGFIMIFLYMHVTYFDHNHSLSPFFFSWYWNLNLGPHAYKAGTQPLKLCPQPSLLQLFFR